MESISAQQKVVEEFKESIGQSEVKKDTMTKHSIEIKGKIYKIKVLDADAGLDLWEYLLQKILPSVGSGLDYMQHTSEFAASSVFADAMSQLSNKLTGTTMKDVSMNLFQGATVDGKPLDFKEEFKGNYNSWKTLLAFALKENFGSFFEEGWGDSLTSLVSLVVPLQSQESQE